MIEIMILVFAFFLAWNVGANNTANCVGVSVGGGVLGWRRAMLIVIVFVIVGAVLEGWKNMRTVGEGIIIPTSSGVNPFSLFPRVALASLITATVWMFAATFIGYPMSVSLSTVSAVVGAGLAMNLTHPELVFGLQYARVSAIVVSWALNPIFSALLSFLIYYVVTTGLRRIKNLLQFNLILKALILIASAYSAYVLGANDVGVSMGVVQAFFGGPPHLLALFGALALAVGTLIFSRRVITTIGSGIAKIGPTTALSAQLGAALTVWSFVQFGIPVSTSEAIVGGVAGAGIFKGTTTVSRQRLGKILLTLLITPAAVGFLSFMVAILLGI
ncbi:MAG: anion permease [Candidatus Hadarchaeaceae archaeon]